jgi:hypothetical protein
VQKHFAIFQSYIQEPIVFFLGGITIPIIAKILYSTLEIQKTARSITGHDSMLATFEVITGAEELVRARKTSEDSENALDTLDVH